MFGLKRLYDWTEVPENFALVAHLGFIVLWVVLGLRTLRENLASPLFMSTVAVVGLGASMLVIVLVTKTIRYLIDEAPWSSSANAAVQAYLLSLVFLLFPIMTAFFEAVTVAPIMTGMCELLVFRPLYLVIMIVLPAFACACEKLKRKTS